MQNPPRKFCRMRFCASQTHRLGTILPPKNHDKDNATFRRCVAPATELFEALAELTDHTTFENVQCRAPSLDVDIPKIWRRSTPPSPNCQNHQSTERQNHDRRQNPRSTTSAMVPPNRTPQHDRHHRINPTHRLTSVMQSL
jgi:hypothetical protein